jgi:plasmid stabilization system protein ParE
LALRVRYTLAAQRDLYGVAEYYEQQRPGLGLAFLSEVDACIELILANPLMSQEIAQGMRRSLTRKFPYAVYYRYTSNNIIVLGVFHSSRSPMVWKKRVQEDE